MKIKIKKNPSAVVPPQEFQGVISDVRSIIESGRQFVYDSIYKMQTMTYWNVGRRIVEEDQGGKRRAEYGTEVMKAIAEDLRKDYARIPMCNIVKACLHNLLLTHFRPLLKCADYDARLLYMNIASKECWN